VDVGDFCDREGPRRSRTDRLCISAGGTMGLRRPAASEFDSRPVPGCIEQPTDDGLMPTERRESWNESGVTARRDGLARARVKALLIQRFNSAAP